MEWSAVPNSEVMWASVIKWDGERAYVGTNHGSVYQLANGVLSRLSQLGKSLAPISEIFVGGAIVRVQLPVRQLCEIENGELTDKVSHGSTVSNLDGGNLAVWSWGGEGLRIQTLNGKVVREFAKNLKLPEGLVVPYLTPQLLFAHATGKLCIFNRLDEALEYMLPLPCDRSLHVTPGGVLVTVGGFKVDDPDRRVVSAFDSATGDSIEGPKGTVYLGVAGDYTILKDGVFDKDWKRLSAFDRPPVAWTATPQQIAWAVPEMEVVWGHENPKSHVINIFDIAGKKLQSVTIPNTAVQGVGAMAFCGDRLLVGGNKLVWVAGI